MSHRAQVLVIAKEPRAGHAKTRLTPPLTPAQAAAVATASLLDTLAAVTATDVAVRTVVLDGSPAGWLPPGFDVVPQVEGGLGARLDAAFAGAFARHDLPVLLIGMDTPQVTPDLLRQALDALQRGDNDAVLGLAEDGGWWALGMRKPASGVFDGVPMSTAGTGAAQRQRLTDLRLTTEELPVLRDIDHIEDLTAVAGLLSTDSRTARLVRDL